MTKGNRSALGAHVAKGGGQASQAAEGSHTWCLGRTSQVGSWMAPPPAIRRGRTLCGMPWRVAAAPMARRPPSSSLEQGHVVEVQRMPGDRQIPHQNNQSFLLRFDCGDASPFLRFWDSACQNGPTCFAYVTAGNTRAHNSTGDGFNCVSPFLPCAIHVLCVRIWFSVSSVWCGRDCGSCFHRCALLTHVCMCHGDDPTWLGRSTFCAILKQGI